MYRVVKDFNFCLLVVNLILPKKVIFQKLTFDSILLNEIVLFSQRIGSNEGDCESGCQ